jgi:hypothetical protein
VGTIDEIRILEAGQYRPLVAASRDGAQQEDIAPRYPNETASQVRFTFRDHSGNGYPVPCLAVIGKGFARSVKYLEVTGRNGNAVRVDLQPMPAPNLRPDYPWDAVFFLQDPRVPLPRGAEVREVPDPYREGRLLHVLHDPGDPARFQRPLARTRYAQLFEDLRQGTCIAVPGTLLLVEAFAVVQALDRIWRALQAVRPWRVYLLGQTSPEIREPGS